MELDELLSSRRFHAAIMQQKRLKQKGHLVKATVSYRLNHAGDASAPRCSHRQASCRQFAVAPLSPESRERNCSIQDGRRIGKDGLLGSHGIMKGLAALRPRGQSLRRAESSLKPATFPELEPACAVRRTSSAEM
jgi:hypothetical protein